MNFISLRSGGIVALSVFSMAMTACTSSFFESDTVDYKSARPSTRLNVPPDLTRLENSQNYQIPGETVDFVGHMTTPEVATTSSLSNSMGDVTLKRDGDKRWLLVERSPEEVWSTLEAFWQDLGFVLEVDEPKVGILETDWAENRANIPQDFIRGTLGKVFDSLYSTGQRDKFRTRVEVSGKGTEIFITHRGVEEVYTDREQVTTVWQPRPTDSDLEAEMLRRLMVRLGASDEASKAAIAQIDNTPRRTQMLSVEGIPELELNEDFDDAWRWVGISLDRISFTVVDRDRQAGIYHVRYIDPVADTVANEKGLFSGLFRGRTASNVEKDYQIKLNPSRDNTLIQVLNKEGGLVDSEVATRILNALAKDLQ